MIANEGEQYKAMIAAWICPLQVLQRAQTHAGVPGSRQLAKAMRRPSQGKRIRNPVSRSRSAGSSK